MTSEITEAMVEDAGNELIGYGTDHGWFRCPATMAEFFEHDPVGYSEFEAIVTEMLEAALTARPAPEAGSMVTRDERQAAWAALRMIRDAVGELFGVVASIESEEAVLFRGPEYHHEAEATIAALQRVATALAAALPPGEDDPERCVICDERLEDGVKVYWSSNDDGHMHAECATSYVDEDGRETQAPPTPFTFKASEPASPIESQAAQIASLSAKVAEVERERDREGLRAEEQWAGWVKADVAKRNAEARASELRREVERLRAAIDDALGRHQVTHIHAGLRAALQQEGESDA